MKEDMIEMIHQAIENSGQEVSVEMKQKLERIFIKLIDEQQTPQQAFEISDDVMEVCYKQAYLLFKAGKFREAIKIFESLRNLNANDARYSLAIAASFHHLKEYSKAAANYIICKEVDVFNPIPSFHLYDCLMQLDQPLLAANALAEVIVKSKANASYAKLGEKALLEQANLTERLAKWRQAHQGEHQKKESI